MDGCDLWSLCFPVALIYGRLVLSKLKMNDSTLSNSLLYVYACIDTLKLCMTELSLFNSNGCAQSFVN